MKGLICRALFMVCLGGVGHLAFNTDMYAEAFLLFITGLAVVFYDAATDKKGKQND